MIVGSNRPRIDVLDKVLGRPVFAADMKIEGALHAVVFRSPRPHAWIRGVDVRRGIFPARHCKGCQLGGYPG